MKVSAIARKSAPSRPDTLVTFAFEDAKDARADAALARLVAEASRNEEFKGKEKAVLAFYPAGGVPARRVVVAGLGRNGKVDAEKFRRAAAAAANRLKAGAPEVLVRLPEGGRADVSLREQAQAVTEGFLLSGYEYSKWKSVKPAPSKVGTVRIEAGSSADLVDVNEGVRRGRIFAEATCLTRDLVNEPPSICTPRYLADAARDVARGDRTISIRVIDEKAAKRLGMGGLLGVSAGSTEPPRFVHLTYRAPGAKKTIAVCGKGITFDSGGLCIKPADGMLNMKDDMSGAAAVIGLFRALREFKPKVNVHGIIAASENMPGGSAYKTRDVLRAMNGKTMEIINTDAEGRLVLSDALSYASRLKPDAILDLATLTGAAVVALGPEISAVFGTDQNLVNQVVAAGRSTGEKFWPMPLEEEYWDMIKSDVADMKNSGGRWGGSITAALFLKQFVDEGIPWAHLDIAGPALVESAHVYKPAGGTGVGVRTLLRYLENVAG